MESWSKGCKVNLPTSICYNVLSFKCIMHLSATHMEYHDSVCRAPLPSAVNITDGAWHMLTLTTHPDGTRGFQLFVDGRLSAQLPSAFTGEVDEATGIITVRACIENAWISIDHLIQNTHVDRLHQESFDNLPPLYWNVMKPFCIYSGA